MEPAIEVRDVSKTYILRHHEPKTLRHRFVSLPRRSERPKVERLQALRSISLMVARGEALALLGPNGSGKSTLLQIIAGIIKPTSGEVITRGYIAPLIELGVGFHPELTGEENVYLNASLYGLMNSETRERYSDIVEFSELEEFMDVPVKNYSSGMYIRLAFSVAVNLEPDILVADELLAVGDIDFQQKCKERITEMLGRDTALIFVTHSPDYASEFCDRYIYIEKGAIVRQGDLDKQMCD